MARTLADKKRGASKAKTKTKPKSAGKISKAKVKAKVKMASSVSSSTVLSKTNADVAVGEKYVVKHRSHVVKVKRLLLDDALKQGNFEGWSSARIRAYEQREQNPNAYYYR